MKHRLLILVGVVVLLFPVGAMAAPTSVDWQVLNTVNLPERSRDVAVAADGRIYLLSADGNVRILASDGSDMGTIEVGIDADRLTLGPAGERLYISDSEGRKMKIIALTDIVDIPAAGSPYRGPADAAISVVVFSDFQ